ncbi:hypothetical protein LJR225_005162 [Phenylobacterium sp. LjRoot225]|uniref:hypothetical protein n=1 Tax=Phenylobacterium sp. LjRoot225 TaxID=3342285 RepID=UPI003ECE4493
MIDALTERQLEAVELILAAAAASPAMADEATREAMDFARPLLETAPALSAFVAQLGRQIARTGQDKTPQGRALARSAGELVRLARPD